MSESKHTKGKWEVTEQNKESGFRINSGVFVIADTVGMTHTEGKPQEDVETIANANLIAAAPDLLEALKGMLNWARRVEAQNPGMEILNAHNAIGKANNHKLNALGQTRSKKCLQPKN